MLTAYTLAAVMVTACIQTPEPRCWTEKAIYRVSAAPIDAPMPVRRP